MSVVNVSFGKSQKAIFSHKGGRIGVDTAFELYQKKSRFMMDGKTLNVNRFGETNDIHRAAIDGLHKVVAKLIEDAPQQIDYVSEAWGATPVHLATQENHHEVVRLLADKGANLDLTDEDGATPLIVAIQLVGNHGMLEIVRLLADKGANLDLALESGCTPVCVAAKGGHLDTVGVLADKGANLDLAMEDGSTPVHVAVLQGQHKVLGILADKGANLDLANEYGNTPMHFAASDGSHEGVRVLLDKGANPNLKNIAGRTPVSFARANGHHRVVDMINTSIRRRMIESSNVRSMARQLDVNEDVEGVIRGLLGL